MSDKMTGFQRFRDSLIPGTILGKVYSLKTKQEEWNKLFYNRLNEKTKDYSEEQITVLSDTLAEAILTSRGRVEIGEKKLSRKAKIKGALEGLLMEFTTYFPFAVACGHNFISENNLSIGKTIILAGTSLILRPYMYNSLGREIETRDEMIRLEKKKQESLL